MSLSGIEATSVGIYEGFAGEAGPLLLELQQSSSTTWNIPADTELEVDELRRLEQSGFYVVVSGPQGQLRGQLLPEGVKLYTVSLSPDEVVGPSVVTSMASASAFATYRLETAELTINLQTNSPTASGVSLHQAPFGENGPLLFSLSGVDTPDVWSLATTALPADRQAALDAHELYLSVTSPDFPEGELRGQIIVGADEPMTSATVGTNGGKLLLDDPAGSEFELTIPAHALLDETVITMERAELPDGFPPGIRPLAGHPGSGRHDVFGGADADGRGCLGGGCWRRSSGLYHQ